MKTVRVKSAYPLYGAALIWLIMGLITPIYSGVWIVVTACLSVGAYFALDAFVFKGRLVEVEDPVSTGDAELDRQLTEARGTLSRFADASKTLKDEALKQRLDRVITSGRAIVNEVARDPREGKDIYTFFSYYLPTIDKLMNYYGMLGSAGTGENASEARGRIADSMEMIASAFEKQQDKLYRNEVMDVKTDIAVIKTMLKSEGLAE